MMKKLLVSLLSALLCMSVVAETESQLNGNQNETDVKIDENGDVFVAPLKYHISSDSTAEVIWDYSSYKKLESVVIPSEIRVDGHVYSVTIIGEKAFSFCSGLTSIEIPSSVTSIRNSAFSCCAGLTNINVATDNQIYTSENGVLYNKDKTELICVLGAMSGKFVVPSGVTSIGDYAFSQYYSLTNIEIPSGVTSIRKGAFSFCIEMKSIKIPSSVTSIGAYAFSGCYSLTNIKIPSGVTSIREGTFRECQGMKSIKIPSSVTSIGNKAFSACIGMKSIKIPSSVTSIGDEAFCECYNLDIVIDNSKENVTVGKSAFRHCKSVKYLK